MEILARISKNSNQNREEIFTRLYRYLLRPDIYYEAYRNLYANSGAGTKGVDEDTADGFSEAKIARIIKSLVNESYYPKPVRRMYIQKANGKKRPLGIPTFTDKLVQEALRMILQAVYEPLFLNCSHGFRPNRSCHTALTQIKQEFSGARWFVEGDIKGCFDHIDHSVLLGLINRKIKDARLIKLIGKFLKAGYLEDWKYHNTYSGTPQGGIVSPILSNICLAYLMEYSCLRTLAGKHKSSVPKIIEKFQDGKGRWGIPYDTKKEKKRCYFADYTDCKSVKNPTDRITYATQMYRCSVNTLENRLKGCVCELCGTTTSDHYEIHHINKLKNLKGKEPWERAMIGKRRKTLVVCRECHHLIHHPKSSN